MGLKVTIFKTQGGVSTLFIPYSKKDETLEIFLLPIHFSSFQFLWFCTAASFVVAISYRQ